MWGVVPFEDDGGKGSSINSTNAFSNASLKAHKSKDNSWL